jgi:hypothetical protein
MQQGGTQTRVVADGVAAKRVDVREDALQLSSTQLAVEDRRWNGSQQLLAARHAARGLEDLVDGFSPGHEAQVGECGTCRVDLRSICGQVVVVWTDVDGRATPEA